MYEAIAEVRHDTSLLAPITSEHHQIDYDQFQRYSAVAEILDNMLRRVRGPIRILEVGSNVLNLLPKFLNSDRIEVVRCDLIADHSDPSFVLLQKDAPLFPFRTPPLMR